MRAISGKHNLRVNVSFHSFSRAGRVEGGVIELLGPTCCVNVNKFRRKFPSRPRSGAEARQPPIILSDRWMGKPQWFILLKLFSCLSPPSHPPHSRRLSTSGSRTRESLFAEEKGLRKDFQIETAITRKWEKFSFHNVSFEWSLRSWISQEEGEEIVQWNFSGLMQERNILRRWIFNFSIMSFVESFWSWRWNENSNSSALVGVTLQSSIVGNNVDAAFESSQAVRAVQRCDRLKAYWELKIFRTKFEHPWPQSITCRLKSGKSFPLWTKMLNILLILAITRARVGECDA